jgi:hypothetical protein
VSELLVVGAWVRPVSFQFVGAILGALILPIRLDCCGLGLR